MGYDCVVSVPSPYQATSWLLCLPLNSPLVFVSNGQSNELDKFRLTAYVGNMMGFHFI